MDHRLLFIAIVSLASAVRLADGSPESVVQKQLEAYNAHDIDAFVATYAEDAQLFELPEKLLARGTDEIRTRYAAPFADARLHAEIRNRIVVGNTVVDHEYVQRTYPEGPGSIEAIAVYEVRDEKIVNVWFRRAERNLDVAHPR